MKNKNTKKNRKHQRSYASFSEYYPCASRHRGHRFGQLPDFLGVERTGPRDCRRTNVSLRFICHRSGRRPSQKPIGTIRTLPCVTSFVILKLCSQLSQSLGWFNFFVCFICQNFGYAPLFHSYRQIIRRHNIRGYRACVKYVLPGAAYSRRITWTVFRKFY